jgi:preprotein translocase subunit YajC
MWNLLLLLADGEAPTKAAEGAPAAPPWFNMMLLAGPLVLLWLILIRPMRRQEQERQALASSVKKNDKIITTSGIYGTIIAVSDKEDEITVRLDENVKIRMQKAAVGRNLTNEEAARAAAGKPPTQEGAA